MKIRQKFAKNLKKFRIEKNLTQEALAEKIDVTLRYVQRLESENECPNVGIETLEKFAKALKVKPYDFLK